MVDLLCYEEERDSDRMVGGDGHSHNLCSHHYTGSFHGVPVTAQSDGNTTNIEQD